METKDVIGLMLNFAMFVVALITLFVAIVALVIALK
ncbi:putative holin-like toxin [Paenibacillus sp. NPDC057967]